LGERKVINTMAVFAVIAVPPKEVEKLGAAITEAFGATNLRLSDDNWLISTAGTAQEISDKLQIPKGVVGSAVVVGVSGYFGRANPNVWAWLKTHMEQVPSG
jgi:hypothetical protein